MAAGISIEPMVERHVPEVASIERVSNKAPWSENSFRTELANKQATYVVAKSGNEVIGFAGMWAIVDEAHVTTIAVHPDHRGKGIAKQLMIRLLSTAKELGMTCSTLEVRSSNEAAISLYEKLGYQSCGLRKRYYPNDREDAVVMWLYGLTEESS